MANVNDAQNLCAAAVKILLRSDPSMLRHLLRITRVYWCASVVSTLFFLLAIAAAKPDLITSARKGESIGDEQARKLREQIDHSPDEADARAQLLGYELSRKAENRESRLANILWMIENHATDPLTQSIYCQLDPADDPESYAKAKAAWDAQVSAHNTDAAVVASAAGFYASSDFSAADALLQQATNLQPRNADWPERLAQLYEKQFKKHPDEAAKLAPAALQFRQTAYNLTPDPSHRFAILVPMPNDALSCADLISAKRYARQLVATAPKYKTDPAYGDAIYWGNLALGEVAFRAGKTDDAEDYLTAAMQTPGSDSLATAGPDFTLAKELLGKGERTSVRDYLIACKKLWPAGEQRLTSWIATLDAGGTPDL